MTARLELPHRAEIRLAGSGGRELITGMHILFRALALEGRRAAQSQSYEPTSRGGFCFSDLVVSDDSDDYPLATRLDMVAALSQIGLDRSLPLIKPGALMIVDERLVPDLPKATSTSTSCRSPPGRSRSAAPASPMSWRSARSPASAGWSPRKSWSKRCGWRRRRSSPISTWLRFGKDGRSSARRPGPESRCGLQRRRADDDVRDWPKIGFVRAPA